MTEGADASFAALAGAGPGDAGRSGAARGWTAVRAHPQLVAGTCILAAMLAMAVLAPLLTSSDPQALSMDDRLQPASARHWLGSDDLGRDVYARVLYGARVSLSVGFFAALFSCVSGAALGLLAGASRKADGVIMRVMDGLMSIPPILLAIAMMAVTGASARNVILAVTIVEAPRVARLVRGVVLSQREQLYVEAAIASGSSGLQVVVRHLLPAVLGPLTVQATFVWGAAMLIEAALSFIGAGIPPTTPSWGNIMADGKSLWQIRPNLVFAPAAFLSLTVLGVNLLGDGLTRILDPRAAGKRS